MDNISFYKPLMALAMKEIIENIGWVDEIGYLVISYFTKQRYDLSQLENVIESESEITEISGNISLLAYKKVLESYTYKNEKKYRAMLLNGVKNQDRLTQWQIDDEILNSIKF